MHSIGRKQKEKVDPLTSDTNKSGLLIPMKGVEEDFDESNANLDRILEDLETYRKEYQRKYKCPPPPNPSTNRS